MSTAGIDLEPDLFEDAYRAGVTRQLPPDETEAPIRVGPAEAIALEGCVLAPDRVIERGYVVVGTSRTIDAVQESKPAGVAVHPTDGVICPGLIDLHGHPEFNVFSPWEPPERFVNRYAWRDSELYKRLVREPQNVLKRALPDQTQLRYAEVRALVGGVTAIQGTSERVDLLQEESLVRNVDKWIFGRHQARAMIDLPSSGGRGMEQLTEILDGIGNGEVDAFYLHLAEGRSDNARSREELDRLVELNALTPSTVIIHGTALSREQLADIKDAGAKLVWSPQSNLRLYGETTRAADALELGVPVALGADWLPSGSTSLLAEMKVARRCLADQGRPVEAKALVDMVTSQAAQIAGLGDQLGRVARDRPADLAIFERRHEDPYESVARADPSEVELVMIDGDLPYGRADWMRQLIPPEHHGRLEELIAWGKRMVLDTGYAVRPAGVPPTLEQLRALLLEHHPQVGPIFA